MSDEATVFADVRGDTAYVTLNRPAQRNALARQVHHDLAHVVDSVVLEPDVRFVVLRGSGGTFSSGGDVAELGSGLPEDYVEDYWRRMAGTVLRWRDLGQVVVAAVDGVAIGAGAALALAADIVVADQDARFRFSFVRIGFVPDAGATVTLARTVGAAHARDLLLSARSVTAAEARDMGMIARTAPSGGLTDAVENLLTDLREAPPRAIALTKDLLASVATPDIDAAVRREGVYQRAAEATGEYRERLSSLRP